MYEAKYGKAEIESNKAHWETDKISSNIMCSFLEIDYFDKATLFELQLGKYDFMVTMENKKTLPDNNENTIPISTPKSSFNASLFPIFTTPKPTQKPVTSNVIVYSAHVEKDTYGRYQISVRFKNNESVGVDQIDFRVKCYDAYGDLIKAYNYYDEVELSFDNTIKRGAISESDWYWRLSGYSNVKSIEIAVIKYHTTSGRTVTIPEDYFVWKKFK